MEAMALRLLGAGPGADRRVRALQQFIGEGAWDDDGLLAAHRRLVDETLGEDDGVLIIDGSDIPKRGTHSAGVARQWCGATGKTDNCQAGVYLGYASRRGYTLLDRRLYLPEGLVHGGVPGALAGLRHPGGHHRSRPSTQLAADAGGGGAAGGRRCGRAG